MGNRILTILAIILCLSASLPATAVERNVEKSIDVKRGGTLYLNSDLGGVEISSHAQNTVQVKVRMVAHTSSDSRAEDIFNNFTLDFNKNDKDVTISGSLPKRWFWNNYHLSVYFNVTVPEQYNLDVRTGGGRIIVGDIKGQVTVKTSGGGIKLGNIKGEVNARTSGGGIDVKDVTGNASVKTSGGGIRIGSVKGNLEARTSGGPIIAELTRQVDGPVELRTSGGGIRLTIPADFKANLDASTSGGRVYSDIPITVHGKISNTTINGKINGGGPELRLRSSGGGIRIEQSTH